MPLIHFDPLGRPVAFLDGAESLLEPLASIAHGWSGRATHEAGGDPLFTVRRRRGGFRIDAPWLDEPVIEPDAFRAAANLAVDLAEAYLAENPDLLSIHCAAAVFDRKLVIFPGRARAGKSTLSVRLAAAGIPILTDDFLVLSGPEDRMGMSLGLTVRLRLPLPDRASEAFRGFVADHRGPSDADYVYLDLPGSLRPCFGTTSPVSAVVLLDRTEAGEATVAPVGRGEGLHELILQNLSLGVRASDAVRRLRRVIERAPCFTLRYSDLDQACAVLLDLFADWGALPIPPGAKQRAPRAARGDRPAFPDAGEPKYQARPTVAVHTIDGALFLVCGESDSIYRLNDISFGLWNLVEAPTSAAEAAAILRGAFPRIESERIDKDVRAFFAEFAARGLIRAI